MPLSVLADSWSDGSRPASKGTGNCAARVARARTHGMLPTVHSGCTAPWNVEEVCPATPASDLFFSQVPRLSCTALAPVAVILFRSFRSRFWLSFRFRFRFRFPACPSHFPVGKEVLCGDLCLRSPRPPPSVLPPLREMLGFYHAGGRPTCSHHAGGRHVTLTARAPTTQVGDPRASTTKVGDASLCNLDVMCMRSLPTYPQWICGMQSLLACPQWICGNCFFEVSKVYFHKPSG